MAIYKNSIPILEYDDNKKSVIMPNRAGLYSFPKYAVFAFLGDEIEKFAKKMSLEQIGEFISITKIYPIYIFRYKEKDICLCQAPVGASASVQILDFLIGYGAEKIISAGSCGTLTDIEENLFLIPIEALRDEGTSYHYLHPKRTICANKNAVSAIERAFLKNNISYQKCKTWSTDGFFRETKDMVEYRRQEGFCVVEMECSALMACAEFRKVEFGQILFTADTLANIDNHNDRNWGAGSLSLALKLCFDAVVEL
ncbi:nucleoside phosphorylase [Peptostreptococcaceae bacterium oral taxon 081]|nr:nucleoside phosphorylase [Peptostreptococcaceae bacterium oral taxon 081]